MYQWIIVIIFVFCLWKMPEIVKRWRENRKNIGFTENDRNRLPGDRSNPGPVLLISGKEENDT